MESLSLKKIVFLSFLFSSLVFASSNDRALKLKQMKEEGRYALIIGNNEYASSKLSSLQNPINDAKAMKEVLERRDFKVLYKENASNKEMKKLLKKFSSNLKKGGVGFFYFAGHGMQIEGDNYLIAKDSDIASKDDVEFESMALNRVIKNMKNSGNRLNIVVLDACRNDPFSRSGGGGLAPVKDAFGMFIAYATEAGSVAKDGVGENGVFTKHLINNIKEEISIEEVFKKTRENVYFETNGEQKPGVYNQMMGDFYFTLPENFENKTKNIVEKRTSSSNNSISIEQNFWETVHKEDSLEYYKMYMDKFPDGLYLAIARQKIDDLKNQKTLRAKVYKDDMITVQKTFLFTDIHYPDEIVFAKSGDGVGSQWQSYSATLGNFYDTLFEKLSKENKTLKASEYESECDFLTRESWYSSLELNKQCTNNIASRDNIDYSFNIIIDSTNTLGRFSTSGKLTLIDHKNDNKVLVKEFDKQSDSMLIKEIKGFLKENNILF